MDASSDNDIWISIINARLELLASLKISPLATVSKLQMTIEADPQLADHPERCFTHWWVRRIGGSQLDAPIPMPEAAPLLYVKPLGSALGLRDGSALMLDVRAAASEASREGKGTGGPNGRGKNTSTTTTTNAAADLVLAERRAAATTRVLLQHFTLRMERQNEAHQQALLAALGENANANDGARVNTADTTDAGAARKGPQTASAANGAAAADASPTSYQRRISIYRCPLGHRLEQLRASYGPNSGGLTFWQTVLLATESYCCDKCRKSFSYGAKMYRCSGCDHTNCAQCAK